MNEVLLINPKRRARKAKKSRRKNPMPAALKRYWAAKRSMKPASNPRKRRRRNPIAGVARRRRNPAVRLGNLFGGVMPMVQKALIGSVGSIGMEVAMKQINPLLPAALQPTPGQVGVNDAIQALATVALGRMLSRITRGMSQTAAQGALTVQIHGIARRMLPAGFMGLGYSVPAGVTQGQFWTRPNNLRAFTRPGSPTPLLSAFTRPGSQSPLLRGVPTIARMKTGIPMR